MNLFTYRFILDTFFYCLFLVFILHSVLDGIGNSKNEEATWSLNIVALWVFCYILRDLKNMVRCSVQNRDKNLVSFRFGYDLTLHILLSIAIVFKVILWCTNKLFMYYVIIVISYCTKYFSVPNKLLCVGLREFSIHYCYRLGRDVVERVMNTSWMGKKATRRTSLLCCNDPMYPFSPVLRDISQYSQIFEL